MDWITDEIAVRGIRDAMDHRYLSHQGIGAVLQFYGPDPRPGGFPFAEAARQLYVVDGRPIAPEILGEAVAFIREQRGHDRKLLVCCGRGRSRSPAFVAAYLCAEGSGIQEAYTLLMARRSEVLPPHPDILRSLIARYEPAADWRTLLTAIVKGRRRGG